MKIPSSPCGASRILNLKKIYKKKPYFLTHLTYRTILAGMGEIVCNVTSLQ